MSRIAARRGSSNCSARRTPHELTIGGPAMPTSRSRRPSRRLARFAIARDNGICWRCGHPGADTAGHVIPVETRPDLEFHPDNVRAEHGRTRTVAIDGYSCIGNYAAGSRPAPTTAVRSRTWR